jgi:TRAP-type C4-dicarboxylate transport system permease small subunit
MDAGAGQNRAGVVSVVISAAWVVVGVLRWIARVVVILSFVYMTGAVLAGVMGRYVFNYSISWSEETARFAQIWFVMIGAGITMRRGMHVAVDSLAALLPLQLARIVKVAIALACLWFLGLVAYASLPLIELGWMFETSPVLLVPMWTVYLCLPIGMAYLALETVLSVVDSWDQPFGLREDMAGEKPD